MEEDRAIEDVVFHERKPTVPVAWCVVRGAWKKKRVVDGGKFGTGCGGKLGRSLVEVEF